ncbi:MAG TPA: polysaccharide biosynthesis C-terminal domain-containing protein [Vicinamibacterales bacterium]|jgi:O-antigen/teichoic acid export membrane protein|nr:polysaccharide biosynthesis C-terminal domain-containing protein [Vicinamibacterales bacterium]
MLRNIGSNWLLIMVSMAATYYLTPFTIKTLGQDGYGTWTLITALTGHITLLSLGVPAACVRYLSEHVAANDSRRITETIGSCAGLYLAIGLAAAAAGAVLMFVFQSYQIPSAFQSQAPLAFTLMVVTVATGFMGFLPEGILFAHHDFVRRNIVRLVGIAVRATLTFTLLAVNASLVVLAGIQFACLLLDFGVSWLLIRRRYPAVRIGFSGFNLRMVKKIVSFGFYVLVFNAGARLSFETAALVIGALLTVSTIPYYVVANSLMVYLMEFVIAIEAVISPMTTKLNTEGRAEDIREMFLKWSKVAVSLTIMSGLFLIVLGPRFLSWWIDPSYEEPSGQVLQILMLSGLAFLPIRGVAVPILIGLGKPRLPALAFLIAGLANVTLGALLARPFGLVGIALGTAIPNAIFALVVLVVACREVQVPLGRWAKYVLPRAMLGAVPALGVLLWFRLSLQVRSLPGLIAAAVAMAVVFAFTWVWFVYRGDPYVNLRAQLPTVRAWVRA